MNRVFQINTPAVVSEIIDGEAVIMNLKSGDYYSTEGVGSLLWHGIEQGQTYPQLLDLVRTAFPTVPEDLATAIDPFIDELITHELIREAPTERACALSDQADLPQVNGAREFRAPVLNVYADMRDLLLLDPIHDVDEVGWPTAKSADQ
jgi:Coenzyme PQQ synthesis protein D (PqqD)